MPAPVFASDSRLMLVAPHPDDESLACGVLLQRALSTGAATRVLYATDGDDNPWPQRLLQRKWRLTAADRRAWGKLRRSEALAALNVLGVAASDVRFLGLPDQQLTKILKTDCRFALERLATCINEWRPTHLFVPSTYDTHPDHNALAVMLRLVIANMCSRGSAASVWAYCVHGNSNAFFYHAQELCQSEEEIGIKQQAIRCHKSQLKLSRRRFLSYASRSERLVRLQRCQSSAADGPVKWISRDGEILRVGLTLSTKLMRAAHANLFVLAQDTMERIRCGSIRVPAQSSAAEVLDCRTGDALCRAQYRGNAFTGEFAIPLETFSHADAVFVKLERSAWFFDEAGWVENSVAMGDALTAAITMDIPAPRGSPTMI